MPTSASSPTSTTTTGELIAELPDGERLPKSVLEQLSCNAKLTGVVYDRKGKPIWRTHSRRTVTEAQWQLLIAKWGGCFHCGANPGICQGHHIEPASQGGPTKLDNLVPACWSCHHRIHHDNWQIRKSPDGHHTLHPPDPVSYGPARAPDQPVLYKPDAQHDPDPPPGGGTVDASDRNPAQRRALAGTPQRRIVAANKPRLPPSPGTAGPPISRPGPAAARAALHNARAKRDRQYPSDGGRVVSAQAGRGWSEPSSQQPDPLFTLN